jgi:hypothetical protein
MRREILPIRMTMTREKIKEPVIIKMELRAKKNSGIARRGLLLPQEPGFLMKVKIL